MKKKLTNNLGLKILAIFFSAILWLIVVNINDPVVSVSFTDIEVDIRNADSITSQGKVYEILDGTNKIDVMVRAKRSIVDSISKDNVRAIADMEELTFMDTVGITLSTNKYNDKLESITSSTDNLKINIENVQKVQLVVTSETAGEPASGYVLGSVKTDQNLVRLSGPESVISKVSKAIASVNVAGMSSDISTRVDLKLYDSEENLIENSSIVKNIDSVNVNVEILATKDVPVIFSATGVPAAGHMLSGVNTGIPATVKVAGKQAVIDALTSIEVSDINVTGQNSDMTTIVAIKEYLPDNVYYVGSATDSQISTTIGIEAIERRTFRIPVNNIIATELPDTLVAEFPNLEDPIEIEIAGLKSVVQALSSNTIIGMVSITSLAEELGVEEVPEGIYNRAVTFQIPDSGIESVTEIRVDMLLQKKETANQTTTDQAAEDTATTEEAATN